MTIQAIVNICVANKCLYLLVRFWNGEKLHEREWGSNLTFNGTCFNCFPFFYSFPNQTCQGKFFLTIRAMDDPCLDNIALDKSVHTCSSPGAMSRFCCRRRNPFLGWSFWFGCHWWCCKPVKVEIHWSTVSTGGFHSKSIIEKQS